MYFYKIRIYGDIWNPYQDFLIRKIPIKSGKLACMCMVAMNIKFTYKVIQKKLLMYQKRILFINDSRNIHNRENNNDLTEKLHILVMFACWYTVYILSTTQLQRKLNWSELLSVHWGCCSSHKMWRLGYWCIASYFILKMVYSESGCSEYP